ncbi:MAG: non-canonical purine NTP pyrophosphatase, partial [Burkholderiaceae bacterium]
MKLVLASRNAGKLLELQQAFAPLGVALVTQDSLGIDEAPEPHHTFIENALSKARHAARASGLPAVADDAGLCLDALGGLPGVDTAYFCTQFGYEKSDANNVRAVLEQLAGVVRVARAGLKEPNKPQSAFLYAGPSGVGKTELARTLAEFLFG